MLATPYYLCMPLIKSKSKEAFKANISELIKSGKPKAQAAAIAYSVQRKAPPKKSVWDAMDKKEKK